MCHSNSYKTFSNDIGTTLLSVINPQFNEDFEFTLNYDAENITEHDTGYIPYNLC